VLVLGALAAAAPATRRSTPWWPSGWRRSSRSPAFRLAQRTISTLLDTAPKGLGERIRVLAGTSAGRPVERVRVRPAGGRMLGEVHLRVSRTLPLERVAAIKRGVTASIARELRAPSSPSRRTRSSSTTRRSWSASC
jgi:hypothetical protein